MTTTYTATGTTRRALTHGVGSKHRVEVLDEPARPGERVVRFLDTNEIAAVAVAGLAVTA